MRKLLFLIVAFFAYASLLHAQVSISEPSHKWGVGLRAGAFNQRNTFANKTNITAIDPNNKEWLLLSGICEQTIWQKTELDAGSQCGL